MFAEIVHTSISDDSGHSKIVFVGEGLKLLLESIRAAKGNVLIVNDVHWEILIV